ncbi:MAG TPA: tetratricopeptide repeat protein, partial [Terriglobia bacterium]|nr:tetratricopeptide repeat protein [Terriglobia bacterium]
MESRDREQPVTADPEAKGAVGRGSVCPAEGLWFRVAAGLVQDAEAGRYITHAAGCDVCGPRLRRATEDLADEPTAGEERLVSGLESARPEWQSRLAERLSAASASRPATVTAPPQETGWRWRVLPPFRWGLVGIAAAALVALGGWWWFRQAAQNSPEQLLTEAYSEERTLELRFPGARYAPLRQTRGSMRGSRLSRPTALLRAEARLAPGLAKHPSDPVWLQASGRADLLEWDYEAAIRNFKRAGEAEPDSPDLMRDLAMAYFEKAEAADRAIDYGTAIELLGKVLARNPDDPVALFNRAVTCERMFLYQQAIEDWQHYLRVDPTGGWAGEAQRRLSSLEQKVKASQPRALLTRPAAFVQLMSEGSVASKLPGQAVSMVQSEEYLDVATTQWLPAAFRSKPQIKVGDASVSARQALELLAQALIDGHRDWWLADMLRSRPSPAFSAALAALSQAVTQNGEGDPSDAEIAAKRAERLFRTVGSEAGEVRARLEG